MKPLAIDLCCGLGGWTEGLMAEGYDVVGFDNTQHIYGEHRYPAQLVIQDVLTLHGRQFRDAALIVASPPCQSYSYRAMPWKRAKALPPPDNALFEACFRIQLEASAAAGRHVPMVVENVRGAQKWVGVARWHYGSYYLWGDVPALMPMVQHLTNTNEHSAQVDMFKDYEDKQRQREAEIVIIKEAVEHVAKQMDFPLDKLSYSDEPHIFELEGKKISAAGTAWRDTGTIKMYPATLVTGSPDWTRQSTEMVMAHEVGHIRYEAVTRARSAEMSKLSFDEPLVPFERNGVEHVGSPLRPDGSIRKGHGLEKKYPIYAATQPFDGLAAWETLRQEDGVTDYSRSWWKEFEAGKASSHTAMHETFAEISKLDYVNNKKEKPDSLALMGVKPAWRKLYKAYTKAYKAIQKAQKKAAKP